MAGKRGMKVVLFCGGQGLRIRDAEQVPKPMVTVGGRPILWHLMRWYAHHGHRDFILCLGHQADVIKRYFLEYQETLTNDFVLRPDGRTVELLKRDVTDWQITFVDTGTQSNIGQRLMAVRDHLRGERVFLANYADGVTNLPLPAMLEAFHTRDVIAAFAAVRPTASFHVVQHDAQGVVTSIDHLATSGMRMNGGYFILRQEIFDYMEPGDELVERPFARLIADRKLLAFDYDGFWACMDTFKERQALEEMYARGQTPWMVWRPNGNGAH